MTRHSRRGGPREAAPLKNAFLAGSDFQNSGSLEKVQPSHAALWLARHAGLTLAAACAVAEANAWGRA